MTYYVFVRGIVGNLGTKLLIENKFESLSEYFNQEYLYKILMNYGGLIPPLFMNDNDENDLEEVFDYENISKGGFLAALWKICERNDVGLKYDLSKVPISQSTIEISNFFDINPYRLLTCNSKIIFKKNIKFCNYENYNNDVLIGVTTDDKRRIRIDNETESYLTKDYKDEIDKVLKGCTKNI